ncbi:hypothetical protein [Amycolatopsis sp. NPDC049868]|uniref:hypothetical protein n=1 Tax=Amycolatopsis sp. NPDC049868 TaxID=3363934 RepID=UPI0037A48D7A
MSVTRIAATALAAAAMAALGTAPASAVEAFGKVIAFEHEFTPLTTWENPKGCKQLPSGTQVIFNLTNVPIAIYSDPLCLLPAEPLSVLHPNHGTHVSAVGSFKGWRSNDQLPASCIACVLSRNDDVRVQSART